MDANLSLSRVSGLALSNSESPILVTAKREHLPQHRRNPIRVHVPEMPILSKRVQ